MRKLCLGHYLTWVHVDTSWTEEAFLVTRIFPDEPRKLSLGHYLNSKYMMYKESFLVVSIHQSEQNELRNYLSYHLTRIEDELRKLSLSHCITRASTSWTEETLLFTISPEYVEDEYVTKHNSEYYFNAKKFLFLQIKNEKICFTWKYLW